jgi:hypothetical protein
MCAAASDSSAGILGCTSITAIEDDASGKTCSTHWRKALAKGAWAMMKMPLFMFCCDPMPYQCCVAEYCPIYLVVIMAFYHLFYGKRRIDGLTDVLWSL